MSEYYAVIRSGDSLTHYGIRGMRWGIRKALDRGDNRATSGRQKPHTQGYNDAMRKLQRATTAGGIIGGLAYAAKHKDELRGSNSNRKTSSPSKKKNVTLSSKDRQFLNGMNKSARKGGVLGALTVGGGAVGGAAGTLKYMRQHPKEYEKFKKKYKQMSFKDRMKVSYGMYR